MLENGARCQFRNPRFEGRPFGRKDAKHPQVEVRPGWMRGLSSGSLVVASHSLAVGQTERRPGRDGIGPGPGGAAQAGRGLAVQLRRCPCPRPAPVLWARGPLRPKGEWVRIPASANPRRGLSSSGRRHLVKHSLVHQNPGFGTGTAESITLNISSGNNTVQAQRSSSPHLITYFLEA